jgi:hypothetical protein
MTHTYTLHTRALDETLQVDKLDKRDKLLQKRDQKLLSEKEKFSEAVHDWERQKEQEEKDVSDHLLELSRAEREYKVS